MHGKWFFRTVFCIKPYVAPPDKRSAFMAVEYEGVYKNQAVYKIAMYDMNIDRLKNSRVESTIRKGFFSISLDSQCGPSMR